MPVMLCLWHPATSWHRAAGLAVLPSRYGAAMLGWVPTLGANYEVTDFHRALLQGAEVGNARLSFTPLKNRSFETMKQLKGGGRLPVV